MERKKQAVRNFHKHHLKHSFVEVTAQNKKGIIPSLSKKIPGGAAGGLAAMAATTIVAASVGATGINPRKERDCCPLCTAAFLPPNDYYGQSSEPAGSSFNW